MNVPLALKRLSKVLYVFSGAFLILTAWYLFYKTEKLVGASVFFGFASTFGIVGWIIDGLAS